MTGGCRSRRFAVVSAWLLPLAVAAAGCSGNHSMFNPQGPAARSIADFGWLLLGICLAVYVAVLGALGWAFVRARARTSPPQESRAGTVVAGAVGATAAILVGLTIASASVVKGLDVPESAPMRVDVVGYQWWWDFQYRSDSPQEVVSSPNELHIPVGRPVELRVQSRDVVHSFWVPALQGKRDLIPGQITSTWIQADAAGVYRGQCAEFCGHQHARMAFLVVAQPTDEFEAWIRNQRQPAAAPTTPQATRGQERFLQSTCVTCHTIRGTLALSRVGPDLTRLASRATIAAGTLPNTREPLRRWVANAPAVKPGTRMPRHDLPPEDLDAVVAYLEDLR
jgi:cytochrome c oxidase subunit 2